MISITPKTILSKSTPASGYIPVRFSGIVAVIIGLCSWFGVKLLKGKLKVDDALDVSSVHGIPGIVGALSIGFFASIGTNPAGANGLVYGNASQLWKQLVGIAVSVAWTAFVTLLLALSLKKFTPLLKPVQTGLDVHDHGEANAYDKLSRGESELENSPLLVEEEGKIN